VDAGLLVGGQVLVQRGLADAERAADDGGGLPGGLHPAGDCGLVGVELGWATELHAGVAGMLQFEHGPLEYELALVLGDRHEDSGDDAPRRRDAPPLAYPTGVWHAGRVSVVMPVGNSRWRIALRALATAYLVAKELELIAWDAAESRAYIQGWLSGAEVTEDNITRV
jgi:hypothetical protein